MVYNDIFPGFAWGQIFRFPTGTFPVGTSLRADFRHNPASPILFSVAEGSGISKAGDDYTVSLSAAQTVLMDGTIRTCFDFVREQSPADDTHLGVRVHVPVSGSVTEPTP